jgi:hypothetical protein
MGSRKQSNVGLSGDAALKVERFASIFHDGKSGTAIRNLVLDALTRVKNEADYVELLKRIEEQRRVEDAKKGRRAG